jgi:hypothetical protein
MAFEEVFRCTTSVTYHVNATSPISFKRKRSRTAQSFEFHIGHRVWQLLQDHRRAARLRSITLLQPFDASTIDEHPFSKLSDARKYRDTSLVAKTSHVNQVLKVIRHNALNLRYFE